MAIILKLKQIPLVLICSGILSQPVLADELSELRTQLKAMQQQMQIMQKQINAQDRSLKNQEQFRQQLNHQQASANKSSNGMKSVVHEVADSIAIGGVIEVVANHSSSDVWSGENASDIVLDTFELAIEASATDWVSASLLFLYEDDENDHLNVDEAYISIANSKVTPFYANIGRLYAPFGNFESSMISDPVTLTLAETREELIQFGFAMDNGVYGSAYIFNGDAEQAKSNYSSVDNNHIDNYGLNIGYAIEIDGTAFDIGAAYINNIATSDTLQDLVADNGLCAGNGCIKDYIGGLSLHAVASIGQFKLMAEYITAMDEFAAGELSNFSTAKLQPKAWNLEAAYQFSLAGKDTVVALGYQKTKDMYFDTETTDFYEKAWLASISLGIFENTTLSAEWRHADAYSEVKKAIGHDYDDEDLMQIKLSYEF